MVKCHFDQTVFPRISARLLRVPLNHQENGLVVPGMFAAFTKSSAIGQI